MPGNFQCKTVLGIIIKHSGQNIDRNGIENTLVFMTNSIVAMVLLPRLPRTGGIAVPDLIDLMYCPGPGPAIQEN